jgi:predicted alpha/beta-hydrolase family hydrolase
MISLFQPYRLVQQRFCNHKSEKPRQETGQQTCRHAPAQIRRDQLFGAPLVAGNGEQMTSVVSKLVQVVGYVRRLPD